MKVLAGRSKGLLTLLLAAGCFLGGCQSLFQSGDGEGKASLDDTSSVSGSEEGSETKLTPEERLARYARVRLTADLSHLSANQKQMLPLLIDAANEMDKLFWRQAYGSKEELMERLSGDAQDFARLNYGPWDRLSDNEPFVPGFPVKPLGANFYPTDMTKAEFEQAIAENPDLKESFKSPYTIIRRSDAGALTAIPYHRAYGASLQVAAKKLMEAAHLSENDSFRRYLALRSQALVSDDYQPSDMAWMDMKDNDIDVVIGPIENYEDGLYGIRNAFEAYVLIKDQEWSRRLARYAATLPGLQRNLPVPALYKAESPGTNSDLNAYDVVYYAGDCNAGAKTIAINLPNDEEVQLAKGSRRLQLKNAMRAKYDRIMVPIAKALITEDQRHHVTFDAFFGNTMFHEVAHGLGIKNTVSGKGTVREALKEKGSILEEGKADVLGLFMITKLIEDGTLTDGQVEDYYVTFLAGIFRSVRFGASSSHGKTNMIRFNFFEEMGVFSRSVSTGLYRVNFEKMREAIEALSRKILMLQGDGDYNVAKGFIDRYGIVGPELEEDLQRVNSAGIPVDIVFDQGVDVLLGH